MLKTIHSFPAALTTSEAAKVLNRAPQTLRAWACKGGPIEPIRINGRLAWPVDAIQALLNGKGAK